MRATGFLAAALLLSGAAFDSPSLYVPGVGLAILAALAAAWVGLAARGASAERLPGAWTVTEGQPYGLAVRLQSGPVPPPGGQLVDPLLGSPIPLGPRFGGELTRETAFQRRGRHRLPAVTLQIADPFGLRTVSLRGECDEQVVVLPRIEPVVVPVRAGRLARQGGEGHTRGEESGLDAEAVDVEIDGIRPYRQGTPASRIHWRTVARSSDLVEYRLISGGGSDPLVVLDAYQPASVEFLDRAVRAVASLCVHLAAHGGCAVLLPGEARPRPIDPGLRAWPDLHARLALVERSRRPAAPRHRRSGSVYWVSAAADAAAAAARAGASAGYLVTPGEARPSDAFAVCGCRGRSLQEVRDESLEMVA